MLVTSSLVCIVLHILNKPPTFWGTYYSQVGSSCIMGIVYKSSLKYIAISQFALHEASPNIWTVFLNI